MPGFPGGSDGKESTCNVGNLGSVPGLGRCPGGGHGNQSILKEINPEYLLEGLLLKLKLVQF